MRDEQEISVDNGLCIASLRVSAQLDTQPQHYSDAASQVQVANKRFGYGGHILPWRAPGKAAPKKTASANLVYNGGPVVSAVDACPVFWGRTSTRR